MKRLATKRKDDFLPQQRGRPSGYRPEYAAIAKRMCEQQGATDRDIAQVLGVNVSTVVRWQSQYQDFCAALKTSKSVADKRVERSLYHRAMGYSFEAEKIFCSRNGEVTRVPYIEHVPPDTTACIFWLKNRRPDLWRDRHELNANLDVSAKIVEIRRVIISPAGEDITDKVLEVAPKRIAKSK